MEILYHHAKFGGAQISHAAREGKKNGCLLVTLLNVEVCESFAIKALEFRNGFGTSKYRKRYLIAIITSYYYVQKNRPQLMPR